MSVRVSHQVWQHTTSDGSEMVLLLAIADQANDAGVLWDKGIRLETLADKARFKTIRACQFALARLKELGELYVSAAHGRGMASRYFVTTGMDAATIAAVLQQVFGCTPIEAAHDAEAMVAIQRDKQAERAAEHERRTKSVYRSQPEKVKQVAPIEPEKVKQVAPIEPEKVKQVAPIEPEKVKQVAPIEPEKVKPSARKGEIQRHQNPSFGASPSATPDPIRHDPYVDDGDGDDATGSRLVRFLISQGVGAAKEFVKDEAWADLYIADYQTRRSDGQSKAAIVAAWRLTPLRSESDRFIPQEHTHGTRPRSGNGSPHQLGQNTGRGAPERRATQAHSTDRLARYAGKVAAIEARATDPEPSD